MNTKRGTKNDKRRTVGGLLAAFTLVELMVVIVVIAILVGITLPVSKYAVRRAKDARREVMLASMRSALDDYRATYGEYPITPDKIPPANYSDAIRHYPDNYPTECATSSNSPYTNVNLTSSGTKENIVVKGATLIVNYALTYPLMLKQLDKGVPPFMAFPRLTVVYLPWRTLEESQTTIRRWSKSGYREKTLYYISGDSINRVKAIDPVTGNQWEYICTNGINYQLTPTGPR